MLRQYQKEIDHLSSIRERLLKENPEGGFAVLREDEFLGDWPNRPEALRAGLQHFGNVPFLVKEIHEVLRTLNYSWPTSSQ